MHFLILTWVVYNKNHKRHMYTNINLPLTTSIHHQKNYYYYYYYCYRKYMEINWEYLNVDIGD